MKSNVAKYIPIRVNYGVRSSEESVDIQNLTLPPITNNIQQTFDITMSSIGLEFGHGFSFIGNNKHSWNLEFCFFKNMVLRQAITPQSLGGSVPNFNFSQAGAKLSLSFNF